MKIQYVSGSAFPSEISHTLSKMRMCQAFSDAGHDVLLTAIDSGKEKDLIKFYGLKGGFKISLQKVNFLINNRFTSTEMTSNICEISDRLSLDLKISSQNATTKNNPMKMI